jgi:hypothetical protein
MFENRQLSLPPATEYIETLIEGGDGKLVDGLAHLIASSKTDSHVARCLNDLRVSGENELLGTVTMAINAPGAEAEEIKAQIAKLALRREVLRDFALTLAEAAVLDAKLAPARIRPRTKTYLTCLAQRLMHLRANLADVSSEQGATLLRTLRNIDQEMLVVAFTGQDLKAADYVALNAHHLSIAKTIKSLEGQIIAEMPATSGNMLSNGGVFFKDEVFQRSARFGADLRQLHEKEIVHVDTIPGRGEAYVYAGADLTGVHFEAVIPDEMRAQVSMVLNQELGTKYFGELHPIMEDNNRAEGVLTLLDWKRVRHISSKVGVSVSLVLLCLKYKSQENGDFWCHPV